MGEENTPVTSAEGTGSPTPTGTEQPLADITPSPGVGSGVPSPGTVPESHNIRQLREQYENLKKAYEPYKALGSVDDITGQTGIAGKVLQTVIDLGVGLGYTEADIRQSAAEDPYGTYEFLRNKQKEMETNGQPPDIEKLLERKLEQRLKPFEAERQKQQLDKAQGIFDSTFETQIKEAFKDETLTEDELNYLYDGAFHAFERDKDAVKLLMEGKTSGSIKHMQDSITAFNKAYLARTARDNKRAGLKPPGGATPPGESKKNIDDFIEGNFDLQ